MTQARLGPASNRVAQRDHAGAQPRRGCAQAGGHPAALQPIGKGQMNWGNPGIPVSILSQSSCTMGKGWAPSLPLRARTAARSTASRAPYRPAGPRAATVGASKSALSGKRYAQGICDPNKHRPPQRMTAQVEEVVDTPMPSTPKQIGHMPAAHPRWSPRCQRIARPRPWPPPGSP